MTHLLGNFVFLSDFLRVSLTLLFRVYDRRMIETQRHYGRSTEPTEAPRTKYKFSKIKSKFTKIIFKSLSRCVHEFCPSDSNLKNNLIRYYTPGHIPTLLSDYQKRMKHLSITYLTYNPSGNELLVNLSNEQIYLFDVNNSFQFKYNTYQTLLKDLPSI